MLISFSGEWKVLNSLEEIQHVLSSRVVPGANQGGKCIKPPQYIPPNGHNLSQEKIQATNAEVLSC